MARPKGHGPHHAARRREVIDIAARLFSRKGYGATGIAELCHATGLAKGALYYYIGSKEALLVEIHTSVMTPLLAAAQRIAALEIPAELRLRLLSETLLEVVEHRLEYIRVVEHEIERLSTTHRGRMLEQRRQFENLVVGLHAAAMDSGAFRQLDPRMCMLQFFNMHNYTYQWLRPGGTWDAAFLSASYCEVLFGGFATPDLDLLRIEERVESFRATYDGPSLTGLAPAESPAGSSEQPTELATGG
jgi:AcrR family transcriptional regulator